MRRKIRDKLRQAAAKPKAKGGRPKADPKSYEAKIPKLEDGVKKWLRYGSSGSDSEIVKGKGARRAPREAVGERGIRIREVSLPSQEELLDAKRYSFITEGVENGTIHVDAKWTAPDAVELRWARLPPEEPEEPGSEEIDGHWDGLTWKRGRKKSK